jgi:hypothetical protein
MLFVNNVPFCTRSGGIVAVLSSDVLHGFLGTHISNVRQLRKLAYAIKNSTTIILPRWREIVKELGKSNPKIRDRVMPRDVRTRWNSTFDMLRFAYTYRDAIDKLTGERALKLRDYEVGEGEWEIVRQLRNILKVSNYNFTRVYVSHKLSRVSKL